MSEQAGVDPNELVDIGTISSQNIAARLGIENPKEIDTIKIAIRDEINAMSSHFTLAFADIQTSYEIELNKIRSTFSFVSAHKGALISAGVLLLLVGGIIGAIVGAHV